MVRILNRSVVCPLEVLQQEKLAIFKNWCSGIWWFFGRFKKFKNCQVSSKNYAAVQEGVQKQNYVLASMNDDSPNASQPDQTLTNSKTWGLWCLFSFDNTCVR